MLSLLALSTSMVTTAVGISNHSPVYFLHIVFGRGSIVVGHFLFLRGRGCCCPSDADTAGVDSLLGWLLRRWLFLLLLLLQLLLLLLQLLQLLRADELRFRFPSSPSRHFRPPFQRHAAGSLLALPRMLVATHAIRRPTIMGQWLFFLYIIVLRSGSISSGTPTQTMPLLGRFLVPVGGTDVA